jgi:rod shape-determining protein MreC
VRASSLLFRRGAVLFSVLVVVSVVLMNADRRISVNPLRDVAGVTLLPVQGTAHAIGGALDEVAGFFADARALRRENDELRRTIEHLTAENVQVQSLRQQNESLRQQLGFREARPELQQLPAEVVYRDPTSLRKYVVIDRGRRDGVEPGMAVVSPGGLVGRVQTVDDRRSRVLLLIDQSSAVRGLISEARDAKVESRPDGIIYGRWPYGRLRMRYIDTTAQVKEGAWVLTSGLDDELPRDLVIGQVQNIYKTDVQDTQEADILPAVDPDSVESVSVILRGQ